MEQPNPSFADEFNVPQEYDVRQVAVSLSFKVYRLKVLVKAGLAAFSSACFEFAKSQKKLSTAALRTFRRFFSAIFTAFRGLLLWGSVRRCLLASSLCCHAAFISVSTPGPAHQPCAPRGRLERGTNSAAVESMMSVMSVAMSLMQVPSGIGGCASTITFATWHGRFGPVTNCLRSASFGGSFVLAIFLRFGADVRGMRTFAYTRLSSDSGASKGGRGH